MKLITTGITEIREELFHRVLNDTKDNRNKPFGGLWASTYFQDEENNHYSSWINWCRNNYLEDADDELLQKYSNGIVFELKPETKIYQIDSMDEYLKCLEKYSIILKMFRLKKGIDFEKLSLDYDAIHLTENAIWQMRFILDRSDIMDFYSWDAESFILFNLDCIVQDSITQLNILYK